MPQGTVSYCPPRRNFRPAGRIRDVKLELTVPKFVQSKRRVTGARAAGLQYERKAQAHLASAFYIQNPWFSFWSDGQHTLQYCSPDGLSFNFQSGLITVFEIKLRHTSDSWWQLRHLYIPVVSKLFGDVLWKYAAVEVCRWFDPDTVFPEEFRMLESPFNARPDMFGVHIWRR